MLQDVPTISKAPIVSVVIPSLNSAGFIGRALQSLECQTYRGFEAIVVDGGSTDGTLNVIGRFEKKFDVRVINVGRGSIGMARNRGIANARGKYVCFLDADDFYLAKKLDMAVHELEADDSLDGVFTSFLHYDSRTERTSIGREYRDAIDLRREIFHHSTINLNTLAVRKHTLVARSISFHEGPRGRIGEDWDFAARLAEANCNIRFINIATAVVVKGHASHTTLQRQWKMKLCALLTLLRARDRISSNRPEQCRAIRAALYKAVLAMVLSDRPRGARKLLIIPVPRIVLVCLEAFIAISRIFPASARRRLLETLVAAKSISDNRAMTRLSVNPAWLQEVYKLMAAGVSRSAD